MDSGVRFVFTLAVAVLIITAVSVAWPKFTDQKRPQALEYTYQTLGKSPLGLQIARTLHISEAPTEPVNVASVAGIIIDNAVTAIEKRAQTVIVTHAVTQLMGQFNKLDETQRSEIRTLICNPQSTVSGLGTDR